MNFKENLRVIKSLINRKNEKQKQSRFKNTLKKRKIDWNGKLKCQVYLPRSNGSTDWHDSPSAIESEKIQERKVNMNIFQRIVAVWLQFDSSVLIQTSTKTC